MLAIFNQTSGINIVNIFADKIIGEANDSKTMFVSNQLAAVFIGLSGFIGAIIGNFVVFFLSRRATFIGGHFVMAVCFIIIP